MDKKILVPKGFKFYGENVGIKKHNRDLGIIYSEIICNSAAVFTLNTFCGVSIPIGKENIKDGYLQSVVVTSGIANVATGNEGINNTKKIIKTLAKELNIKENNILPSSTGVIGKQLPIEKILNGIIGINTSLSDKNFLNFAEAIKTTDKKIKYKSIKVGTANILAVAKGSGMIEPNMATMLVYILTDAFLPNDKAYSMLKEAVDLSFNMISIDTDTSTSDTVALMANGLAGKVPEYDFKIALNDICISLAKEIVMDGEGATKLLEIEVNNAINFEQAKKVAKSVVNSPLVKTAVYGEDPNWGRVVMAIGKTMDTTISLDLVQIYFGEYIIYDQGRIKEDTLEKIKDYLFNSNFCKIIINLNIGSESATVWGCDLTDEYIKINGSYTS